MQTTAGPRVKVNHLNFKNCKANVGGALRVLSENVLINGCTFFNCTAVHTVHIFEIAPKIYIYVCSFGVILCVYIFIGHVCRPASSTYSKDDCTFIAVKLT